jgi:uncharacterized membrane protein
MKTALRWILSVAMVFVGVTHFLNPDPFVQIVPSFLPSPLALVYVSGFFEILGGLGLCDPRFRRRAAWGLIALYIAVFPANINMAVNHIQLPGQTLPEWALWARLPAQGLLILWAWWYT